MIGVMAISLIGGSYFGQKIVTSRKSNQSSATLSSLELARQRDKSLNWDEWTLGINSLRRRLACEAHGHVLENSLGAGRNFRFLDWQQITRTSSSDAVKASDDVESKGVISRYFNWAARKFEPASDEPKMESFTGVDLSTDMMVLSMERLVQVLPRLSRSTPATTRSADESKGVEVSYLAGKIRLFKLDSQLALPPAPKSASQKQDEEEVKRYYDTIIQSFGLCSISDPSAAIANLAKAVKPGTGKIILLEHGKGWRIINGYLDRSAPGNFEKWGCWHNRDIEEIVRSAAAGIPGLEVVKVTRPGFFQFGTLIWIELKMNE